jgi:hypothetical protein
MSGDSSSRSDFCSIHAATEQAEFAAAVRPLLSPNTVYLRAEAVLPWLRASRGMGEAAERSAAV